MLKHCTALVFAAFAVAAAPIPISAPQQPPSQSESGKLPATHGQQQERPPVPTPPPREIVDAVTRAINAAAHKAETARPSQQPDNSAWLFNLLLVVFTGGLVAVGAFQAWFLSQTNTATQKVAQAAKESADAVVSQLRAYIVVAGQRDRPPIVNDDGGVEIWLKAINRGQTVAYSTGQWVSMAILPFPLVRPLPERREDDLPRTDIGPASDFEIRGALDPITPAQQAALIGGAVRMYIFGRVVYRDAFGNDRFTSYCHSIPVNANGIFTGLEVYRDGNQST